MCLSLFLFYFSFCFPLPFQSAFTLPFLLIHPHRPTDHNPQPSLPLSSFHSSTPLSPSYPPSAHPSHFTHPYILLAQTATFLSHSFLLAVVCHLTTHQSATLNLNPSPSSSWLWAPLAIHPSSAK
ncbi:hypothetical protein BKA57DRAFT_146275 [Linnemannia elongata]|nr:hypothetical protein BKA57DRAFT_146275 [Linnemannia elongata]